MIRLRTFALISLLLVSPLMAATTVKFSLTSAGWTDLGPGPLLLSFSSGSGVFAVSDTTPTIPLTQGFTIIPGDSKRVETTSHVWAMAINTLGVTAFVAAY